MARPKSITGTDLTFEHVSAPIDRVMADLGLKMAARALVEAARPQAGGLWIDEARFAALAAAVQEQRAA